MLEELRWPIQGGARSGPDVAGSHRRGALRALSARCAGGAALAGRDLDPARPDGRTVTPGEAPPLDFQGVNLGRSPLLVPRDFSAGFIPELLDLDQLFRETDFQLDPSGERLARLLAFPRSHGDAIVLDDVDGYPLDLLFDDALVGDTIASSRRARRRLRSGTDRQPGSARQRRALRRLPGERRPDDPAGPVIPEPTSGLLFALGLAALGFTGGASPPTPGYLQRALSPSLESSTR